MNCIVVLLSAWHGTIRLHASTISPMLVVIAFLLSVTVIFVLRNARKRENEYKTPETLSKDMHRLNRQVKLTVEAEQNLLHIVRIQELVRASTSHIHVPTAKKSDHQSVDCSIVSNQESVVA